MGKATQRGARPGKPGQVRAPGLGLAALALAGLLAALPQSQDAAAQSKKSSKAGESAGPDAQAGVQRAYAAGTRAFEAGDMAGAERNLSVALAGGGLPNAQMARALYLRGSAYRQMGRPAQAISDLTTAIWLKGGLSSEDKAKAMEARQLAYREAGLGDTPPPIGSAPLDQSPATPTAGVPAPAPGTQVVQVTQQSFWNGFSLPSLTGGSPQPAAAAPAAQTAQGTPPSSFWSFLPSLTGGASAPAADAAAAPQAADPAFATTVAAAPDAGAPALGLAAGAAPASAAPAAPSSWETQTASVQLAAAAPQAGVAVSPPSPEIAGLNPVPGASPAGTAPSGAWSNPLAGTGQAVTNFFGGMFGGGSASQEPAAQAAALTTGSTAAAAGGGWGSETSVVTSQTSSMVQRGPDAPTAAVAAPADALPWSTAAAPSQPAQVAAASQGGSYKLQVAAVRSRAEADKLAQSLQSYPAVREGRVGAEVDETVIGSMGTFYRVRLGPYASAQEPDQLCKTLKPQGFDCLVVTQ